jgi:hypothetical protein
MRHPAPWLGWSAWLLAAASLTLVFGLFVWHNDTLAAPDNTEWVLGSLPSLAFVTVGAVVVARRPGNRIGWLCYGIGLGQILAGFGGPAATSALAAGPSPGPIWLVAYELGELCWELTWTLLAMLLLLFPTGQLPSPRWRPVAWAAGAVLVLAAFSGPFLPGPPAPGLPPNPIAIPALAGLLRVAYAAGGVVLAGVILAALVSLIVRFRRARGVERQQLKWFAYGTALLLFLPVAGILGASLAGLVGVLVVAAIVSALPVAIGLAVLRYRLYDIDRLISRTLVYGLLTAVLGAVYAGVVLILGQGSAGSAPSRRAGRWPAPPWPLLPCSSQLAAASRPWWTGALTGAAMTPHGRWTPLRPGCATKWTWTRSRLSCWAWSTRRWSRTWCRCGYDRRRNAPRPPAVDAYQAVSQRSAGLPRRAGCNDSGTCHGFPGWV